MSFRVLGKFPNSCPPESAECHFFCASMKYSGHISKIAHNLQNCNNLLASLFSPFYFKSHEAMIGVFFILVSIMACNAEYILCTCLLSKQMSKSFLYCNLHKKDYSSRKMNISEMIGC